MVGIGLVAAAIALTGLVLLAGTITRPIGALTARAEALVAGSPADLEMRGTRGGGAARTRAAEDGDLDHGRARAAVAERDRLAVLVDELSDALVIADESGRIVLANRAAQTIIAPDAKVGRTLVDVLREHEVLDAIGRARLGEDEVAEVERAEAPRFACVVARRIAYQARSRASHQWASYR